MFLYCTMSKVVDQNITCELLNLKRGQVGTRRYQDTYAERNPVILSNASLCIETPKKNFAAFMLFLQFSSCFGMYDFTKNLQFLQHFPLANQ